MPVLLALLAPLQEPHLEAPALQLPPRAEETFSVAAVYGSTVYGSTVYGSTASEIQVSLPLQHKWRHHNHKWV
eukprot:2821047-Rhodomonas_salina.1